MGVNADPDPWRGRTSQLKKELTAAAAENKELLTICNQLLSQVEKSGAAAPLQ